VCRASSRGKDERPLTFIAKGLFDVRGMVLEIEDIQWRGDDHAAPDAQLRDLIEERRR
jgi:hypothetical protein